MKVLILIVLGMEVLDHLILILNVLLYTLQVFGDLAI